MIHWHPNNSTENAGKFSIIIPTWNNLPFLKICIDSITKNSAFKHQIIIHVNEGTDGTYEWVSKSGYDFTYSTENVGVCLALNASRSLVRTDYIYFLNDDMYLLPDWDIELWKVIESQPDNYFFLSSTTIEPRNSPHPGILAPFDFGNTPETFREDRLLKEFRSIKGNDWSGATWPPNIVHKDIWDLIGGYSIEYFPGFYSDPDFSMKLYEVGVRHFIGVNTSRTYHFGSKSTMRVESNNGSKQFLNKWGITSASFTRLFLNRGQVLRDGILTDPCKRKLKRAMFRSNLKRIFWSFTGNGKVKSKFSPS
jgi:glycosyltransferase involved in cell wall biosynthesis